jgi:hypothetical protein
MSALLESMFDGLVIYVWNNPLNDDDCGAVIISEKNFIEVQEISGEYISDEPYVESFRDFESALYCAEIPYHNVSGIMHYHIYDKE